MKISNYFLIAVGGAVIGAASGFAWRALDSAGQPAIPMPIQGVEQTDVLPGFSYPDLDGLQRSHQEFADKIMVLNFWASWCPPCRKETPDFIALQDTFAGQVQFVGIAIDDPEPVREFAEAYGINYPVLLGDTDAVTLSRQLGNRHEGLPFTVVIATNGRVMMRHAGGLERQSLESVLQELTDRG
jgi:thiol-disulfide isomerase/thioredoxin